VMSFAGARPPGSDAWSTDVSCRYNDPWQVQPESIAGWARSH